MKKYLAIIPAAIILFSSAPVFASSININPTSGSDALVTVVGTDGANNMTVTVTGLGAGLCSPAPIDATSSMNDIVICAYGQSMSDFGAGQSDYTVTICNTDFEGQTSNCDDLADPALASADFHWVAPAADACLTSGAMNPETLGNKTDCISQTAMIYSDLLLEKWWPFLVGFIILVGVWIFGKKILTNFQ